LPHSQTEVDASKMALAFYCIGSLDLLGLFHEKTKEHDRASWREWIWQQQTHGRYGSGFRPSPFMTATLNTPDETYTDYDTPHLIMTYTALLSLAIFRDDFSRLDRKGLLAFIRTCQRDDGSFCIVPGSNETDLRSLYCAFAISAMLDDWSAIDMRRAIGYIASCRTYEGGYGQAPFCEAQGGTTYIAIASLHLVPGLSKPPMTPAERQLTIHWLISNYHPSGGFCGRTGKDADACYCFW
ncbi:Geranylgeranyl transferase type-1 subunit beta, partial [Termitomyces sp. T112]